ncbi:multicopper oxidase domain-containing protein [Nocardioides solisilvae]|uniref:multicopper oxidase domain-containing protein n=1 Tax=Nocardioides solisilvae TaxID=1542435 RepID=UPI001EF420D3|nr:multicopper oxidase domain-containing protein [Nocardioides solisilvae]
MSAATRGFWPMRDLPTVAWLLATVAATVLHPWVSAPRWLMVHLLVLGAVGHAILVWSRYFADTLLRCEPTPRRPQDLRLGLFNAGVVAVVAGVLSSTWAATAAGAAAVVLAVGWHGVVLARQLRRALAARFAPTVRYYVAAACLLPFGAGLGAWLARDLPTPLHEQARAAHVALNVFGWIGLTVLGTLVTLWPTMLRTRIADGAERAARRALPLLVGGLLLMVATALADLRPGYVAGLAVYAGGVAVLAVPAVATVRAKAPAHFAPWSVLAALGWLVACLAWLVLRAGTASDWLEVDAALGQVTPLLAAGFAAQVLLGATSYLVPVVLGGGPGPVRAANRVLDSGAGWRLVVANAGLMLCALPVPGPVRVLVSVLVVAALASFVPLLFAAMRASRRARATGDAARDAVGDAVRRGAPDDARPQGQRTGLVAAGVATLLVAVAAGVALDPTALDAPRASAAAGVTATGATTEVEVVAKDMRFHPDTLEVPAGNRLVITLRNADDGDLHDLVLETGARTARLAPGESEVLDVGVVGRDLGGWCSVVGHHQRGMALTVEVTGTPGDHATTPGAPAAGHADGHASHEPTSTYADGSAADLGRTPAADFEAAPAALPPLPPRGPGARPRVHRRTLTVTDSVREVAPGVTQTLWTYGGTAPGPTLHGRVGDVFVITLVNDGSIGHSIDFHAGALAPDRPMRTIAPGESLTYRFTATRAGVWMYHCSTMPMSAHIANGMFGAVVIEPPGLPEVERSYVVVQSELYLGAPGGEVDADALAAERPDAVVFNGYADQYVHRPLPARVGERVRVWVLSAGPNRDLAFHVVGGQFDRVWSEGDWRLGDARAPARHTGSQTLGLMASQGGFVELAFPEPGHYPFVNHVMVDAERGARGLFEVR